MPQRSFLKLAVADVCLEVRAPTTVQSNALQQRVHGHEDLGASTPSCPCGAIAPRAPATPVLFERRALLVSSAQMPSFRPLAFYSWTLRPCSLGALSLFSPISWTPSGRARVVPSLEPPFLDPPGRRACFRFRRGTTLPGCLSMSFLAGGSAARPTPQRRWTRPVPTTVHPGFPDACQT